MGDLIMGKNTYGNINRRGNENTVRVGNYCSIAANCVCDCGWQHNVKFISTYPFNHLFPNQCRSLTGHPVCKGDINIGNDVWIGARSIVTKNIDPYSIVVGSPAKEIRKRFSDLQIEKLLKIKWWDWEDKKVLDNAYLLMNENVDKFIELYEVK